MMLGFTEMKNFLKKILMWIAISNRGMSKPLFRPFKSVAINSNIYINECLSPRLLPFIQKHHSDFNYLFLPDLAGAHYSNECMDENLYLYN